MAKLFCIVPFFFSLACSLYVVPPKSLEIKVYSNQIRANLIFSNLSTTIARAFGSGEKGFYVAGWCYRYRIPITRRIHSGVYFTISLILMKNLFKIK